MKKNIFILLLIAGVIGFIGCNGSSNPSGPAVSGLNQTTSQVRGKIAGKGDLGKVVVCLVAEGALVSPDTNLRAQRAANTSDGQIYFSLTGKDGSFVFNNVLHGIYNLMPSKDQYYSGILNNIEVRANTQLPANDVILSLKATGNIKGQVSLPTDYSAPVSGIVAFIPGTIYSARTDTAGSFAITGVPVGTYTVFISGYGLEHKKVTDVSVTTANTTEMTAVALTIDASSKHMTWKGTLATAPNSPKTNWAYHNSTDKKAYIWNGTTWHTLAVDGLNGSDGKGISWKGELNDPPAKPQLNWAYYNSSHKKSYIFDGSSWQIMVESVPGTDGSDGIPIFWKGELSAAPVNPQLNWAYYNSSHKKSYIYNGTSWDLLAEAVAGKDGTDGSDASGIIWKGSANNEPADPELNWAYFNTTSGNAYIYNGNAWVLLAGAREAKKPIISDLLASGRNLITITWVTNEDATSQVEYGLSTDYGTSTDLDTKYKQNHSVVIADLPFGNYHYRVKSKDAAGNEQVSSDMIFTSSFGSKQMGVAGADTLGRSVTTDSSGNLYITGSTDGNLSGKGLTGKEDFFISKYDSDGTHKWTEQMGVAGAKTFGYSVTTDSGYNVYVSGYTKGGLDEYSLTGIRDFFISKYSSTGTHMWTKQMGVPNACTEGYSVTTDNSGNVYISGSTDGDLSEEGLTGEVDFFISKYISNGTHKWTKQMGVASAQTLGISVTSDSSGNLYIGGSTDGNLSGKGLTGKEDFFISKYDSDGTHKWTEQMGVAGAKTFGYSVTTDSSDNVYIGGFADGDLSDKGLTGEEDFFISKYDSDGTHKWTEQMGVAGGSASGISVTTDNSDNVYIAGATDGNLSVGGLTGSIDFFISKYNSIGSRIWTKQMGVAGADTFGYSVTTDSSGNVYIGGGTEGGLEGNSVTGDTDYFITAFDENGN